MKSQVVYFSSLRTTENATRCELWRIKNGHRTESKTRNVISSEACPAKGHVDVNNFRGKM